MTRLSGSSPIFLKTSRGTFRVVVDGETSAPALVLSNSLGTTLEMWAPQVGAFAERYRLVRYDSRGHGGSPVTPGPYSFQDLGHDVLAVLDALELDKVGFCGISMGGHTGLWLGIHARDRLNALAICNSAAKLGSTDAWIERAAAVRRGGASAMRTLADSSPGRWFTEGFASRDPETVARAQGWIAGIAPEGYAACCEALAASDLRASIDTITAPTLLLAGAFDPVTTVLEAQAMQAAIAKAQLAVVSASHLSNLEAPDAFERAVLEFLATAAMPS